MEKSYLPHLPFLSYPGSCRGHKWCAFSGGIARTYSWTWMNPWPDENQDCSLEVIRNHDGCVSRDRGGEWVGSNKSTFHEFSPA